ncbi:SOS response-associated peptidase family protein [Pararhizobium sp. BT-229]|uniref:SOS response-associated peptidase family protein n=1 Tax=Pararhizobium sp. BT-229 TaxID=2986923 RepID=UPI0021F70D6C|nr:SOS response-associated peptidase family protein [Pararhizobium sp. BT-229]MCV9960291.1 SOS response-associated peptidase family protein [Pararhizobium sp. BT-229]
MSRLFAVTRTLDEIVEHFGVDVAQPIDVPNETVEGTQGLIVFEKDGLRLLKSVPWGFPRQTREMRKDGEPPGRIGLVADLTNPLWDRLVVDPRYRCLIPLTHFANPDGPKGEKTRTWFSLNLQPLVAWAGFCRNTPDFGPVFAGMTGEANEKIRPFNERMPILLKPDEWDRWLHGSIEDVIAFQFRAMPWEDFEIMHTRDRWKSGTPPSKASSRRDNMLI